MRKPIAILVLAAACAGFVGLLGALHEMGFLGKEVAASAVVSAAVGFVTGTWTILTRREATREEFISALDDFLGHTPQPAGTIAIHCQNCPWEVFVRSSDAGRKVKCPQCGAVIRIPANDEQPS